MVGNLSSQFFLLIVSYNVIKVVQSLESKL